MVGNYINPYTNAPADWKENGLPYGAWCKCHKCGYVGRSTVSFDYRAQGPRAALTCDACEGFSTYATEKAMRSLGGFDIE